MARLHRLPWRLLAGMLLALLGCSLGWLWFRDSSFAAIERVSITGSGSSESAQVRAALEEAGKGQSTLHLDRTSLELAVEPFASVASLHVQPDFPHELRVEVVEHEPVAAVQAGGGSVPATGGGLVLDGVRATGLPLVTSRKPLVDGRVEDPRTLAALRVAAAAPPALRARSVRLYFGSDGMALDLRDGPELIFGSADEARTKWRAAARVLAEDTSAGATYLDLRVPKLVAAGGVGPVPEPDPEPTPAAGVVESNPQP